jgi:Cu(I)/Ag(I) efflux system membrane fusion protein
MRTPAKFILALLLAAGFFFAGYLANRHKDPAASPASAALAAKYACPMHPQYKSDHAGDCPVCGMRLEPVSAAVAGDEPDAADSGTPGLVHISAAKQQLIGVRTNEVRQGSYSHQLRVPGRITVDDDRLYRIIAATEGWILDLGKNAAGRFVKENQLLASYYTRDLLATERLFLLSIGANDGSQREYTNLGTIRTAGSAIQQFPVDSLRGLGMSDLQIGELQRTRTAAPHVNIYSPVAGYILARNISPKQRFEKGTEFYRIADISHVWVQTDIFEKDREFVRPGCKAKIRSQGREFDARMSDVLPQLDPQSRTLKTRFELDNPGNILLPDMFVNMELHLETPEAITVPTDAVIDSGRCKIVYVESSDAVFEPRLVETGWRRGDRVQITHGLKPGERIVVSGNFLIDSESRMRMPDGHNASSSAEKAKLVRDLVCAMTVDPKSPGTLRMRYKGETYYFCSEMCRKSFDANPEKYIDKKADQRMHGAQSMK